MDPLLGQYLDHLVAAETRTATLKAVRSDLVTLIRWYEEAQHRPLRCCDLTPRDVRAWTRSSSKKDQAEAAPATANRRKTSLRGFYQWAINAGALRVDPTRDVRDLPLGDRAPRSASSSAINRMLHAAARSARDPQQALRDEAMLSILAYCGLRVEELCQLSLSDFNPVTRRLLIRAGKGGKSRRAFLHESAFPSFARYLQWRCPDGFTPHSATFTDGPLWMHRATGPGRPWEPSIAQRSVQELVRELGGQEARQLRADAALARRDDQQRALLQLAEELERITPHVFRHSLARRMLAKDVALPEIQAVLGHTSLRTTGIYLVPHDDSVERAFAVGAGTD